MIAWEALTLYSSATTSSTAWTHLNSLTGGTGTGTAISVLDPKFEIGLEVLTFTVEKPEVTFEHIALTSSFEADVPSLEFIVDLDTISFTATTGSYFFNTEVPNYIFTIGNT